MNPLNPTTTSEFSCYGSLLVISDRFRADPDYRRAFWKPPVSDQFVELRFTRLQARVVAALVQARERSNSEARGFYLLQIAGSDRSDDGQNKRC